MAARIRVRAIVELFTLLVPGIALAAPGDLDPTFGQGGRTFIDVPNYYEIASSIVQQSDGKLLIGRQVIAPPIVEDFSVVRLLADGTLDPTFGGNGRTYVRLTDSRGLTNAVLEQADGKVVAVGQVTDENGFGLMYGLVRYNQDGTVDPSFGSMGVVTGTFGATLDSFDSFEAVLEQPDGRLVVAGGVSAKASPRDIIIARFNTDGSLDASFGAAGSLRIDSFGANTDDVAKALVLQRDGKLVAAGLADDENGPNGRRELVMLRITPDGSLDATFGNGGLVWIDLPRAGPDANVGLQLQDDGGLVIGGETRNDDTGECATLVARFTGDGTPDPAFGNNGLVQLPLGWCNWAGSTSIVVDPGGAIIVGDTSGTVADIPVPRYGRVTRLASSGEIDATFGFGGTAIIDMGSQWAGSNVDPDIGIRLARQSDGRIAVAASDWFDWYFGASYFMVARLLASGNSAGLVGSTIDSTSVDESSGSARVNVWRTGGATGAVSVDFATVDGSASSASDYTSTSGTLTWADGEATVKTIVIPVTDDSLVEGPEWFGLKLSNPTGGALLATSSVDVVIVDNDGAPPSPAPSPSPAPQPGPAQGNAQSGGGVADPLLLVALAIVLGCGCRRGRRQRRT